jgi:hypothetical protein
MAINIDEGNQELLLEELEVFARSVSDPAARERYLALRSAVAEGTVDDTLLPSLEKVLEIGLQTGRVRKVHGPQAEQALLRLFHQTPRGAGIRDATRASNEALTGLQGQVIEGLQFSARTPGVYRLVIDTDRCQLTVEIDPAGVWVENVAVAV